MSAMSEMLGPHFDLPVELADALTDPATLPPRQARTDRLLQAEGAGHLVHDLPVRADGRTPGLASRPWRLDPIPVVLDTPTFQWLAAAITERMEALESVVADLYGPRSLVASGVVSAPALASSERFRLGASATKPERWLTNYAVDLTLGTDGVWYVVQDVVDVPAGLGYALLYRSVTSRVVPDLMGDADVASIARFPASARRGLAAASPVSSPRTVVFSGGLDQSSYVDHSYLAVQLGINLVEGADLVVRQHRVWLRTLDGLESVDVIDRRVADTMVDPLEVGASGSIGVPGLLQAVRAGGVVLANAYGTGVIESPDVQRVLPTAFDQLGHTDFALPMLPTAGHPIAQAPLAAGSSLVGAAHAGTVIRMFAVRDRERIVVAPGGTGRVLAPGDDPRLPTACVAKDVWVLGRTTAPVVGTRLPQVDFGRSVPTRAADALYWTNRAAERAESMARVMRVIGSRVEQDPGLLTLAGGEWSTRMIRIGSGIRRGGSWPADGAPTSLASELSTIGDAVADEIGVLLTEATTVREFLSVTTGRVLSHLAELRSSLQARRTVVDDLDAVLADFAAIAGLWRESTVRGTAWRIGDTGRRLERCLVVLDLVEAVLEGREHDAADAFPGAAVDDVQASVLEVLLAASESLVAYRRRYRSDVEIDAALDLVVHDVANPRSLAASIEMLAEHADDEQASVSPEFVTAAREALALDTSAMIPLMRSLVFDAGSAVVSRWFSTPVNPILMRPTGSGW